MKRDKPTYPQIKSIKPFFWKVCRFCDREFKRENGYEIIDYTVVNPQLFTSFCCNECAKSIEEVGNLIMKSKNSKRPPRPPKIR